MADVVRSGVVERLMERRLQGDRRARDRPSPDRRKRGRPRIPDDRRTVTVSFRLTPALYDRLYRFAAETDQKVAAAMRELAETLLAQLK